MTNRLDNIAHDHGFDPPRTHLTPNPTKWLPEHDALLKERVEEKKHSYAQIAADINAAYGTAYSRNATIGRANRLGLDNTRPDQNSRPQGRNRPKLRIVRAAGNSNNLKVIESIERDNIWLMPPARALNLTPLNLTLDELTDATCRFPFGDGPFVFCGHTPFGEKPYCKAHCQISYLPPTERNARSRGFR